MREFIAKILFCDVYDLDNVLMHIPVGVVNALIGTYSGSLAVIVGVGFLSYEIMQRIVERKDKAYTDIQGWLWGLAVTGIILVIVSAI